MKPIFLIAATAMLASLGCATAADETEALTAKAAERLAEFDSTGETVSCLNVTQIRSIDAIDDSHFLVRATGGDYYLNKVSGRCNSASRAGYRLQYTVSGGQLCRNQIITVVDNSGGFTAGSCGLGSFERLSKKTVE